MSGKREKAMKINILRILLSVLVCSTIFLISCQNDGYSRLTPTAYSNLTASEPSSLSSNEAVDITSSTEILHSDDTDTDAENAYSEVIFSDNTGNTILDSSSSDENSSDNTVAVNIYTPAYNEDSYMNNMIYLLSELPPDDYDLEMPGVEYPQFQKYGYYSKTRGRKAYINVLLPRDYSESKKYPVVYVLHGYGTTEDGMATPEMALPVILTNLQEHGQANDMIVVLPYVYCSSENEWDPGLSLESMYAYDNFINDLVNDLMPFMEKNFSVATGKGNTAITGFSMGGREAMFIGFKHPELIGFIGAVAPAPGLVPVEDSELRPGQMQPHEMKFKEVKPYLYLITSSEADGAVRETPDDYRKILSQNKVQFLSQILKEAYHNETVVKPHLYMFFKTIFR